MPGSWNVRLKEPELKKLQLAPRPERERLVRALEAMALDPFTGDVERTTDRDVDRRGRAADVEHAHAVVAADGQQARPCPWSDPVSADVPAGFHPFVQDTDDFDHVGPDRSIVEDVHRRVHRRRWLEAARIPQVQAANMG